MRIYFNPRSHEGSDCLYKLSHLTSYYFNPRSHEGSDCLYHLSVSYFQISIHAPTKGATRMEAIVFRTDSFYFNPRSHEGSDYHKLEFSVSFYNFNPRSHEGSDATETTESLPFTIFQSTLPRRERLYVFALSS